MATQLVAACGMRSVVTQLYDTDDLARVIDTIDPAVAPYQSYLAW